MSAFYIPPNGVYFRLVGQDSQRVLFSRTHAQPEVGNIAAASKYSDQLFTLIPGTGARSGEYMIQGKNTQKVLISRSAGNPTVGHIDRNPDVERDDTWFKLEPGTDKAAQTFRLLCSSTNTVLLSGVGANPVYNEPGPPSAIQSRHYFSFLFEDIKDLRVDNLEFHVELSKITWSTPVTIQSKTLSNSSDEEKEMTFKVYERTLHKGRFKYGTGFTLADGTVVGGPKPDIAEGAVILDPAIDGWIIGQEVTYNKWFHKSYPVKLGPRATVNAVASVKRGDLEVPYTIYLTSDSAGVTVESRGTWYGFATGDLSVSTV
ncbi:hemolytic lectin LSLb [Auriscalpium vulgare]|uniref:Hemolytic lectin LSLb n=1 Tax=Auriscalpium vulgare TaxID=40419 RepID=A0ACB8REK5_9AGAM|nr:hemolytic lectin LSLb [Auriscalpium vulgare]